MLTKKWPINSNHIRLEVRIIDQNFYFAYSARCYCDDYHHCIVELKTPKFTKLLQKSGILHTFKKFHPIHSKTIEWPLKVGTSIKYTPFDMTLMEHVYKLSLIAVLFLLTKYRINSFHWTNFTTVNVEPQNIYRILNVYLGKCHLYWICLIRQLNKITSFLHIR